MIRSTVITDASFCPHTRAGGWAAWINVNWPEGRHERILRGGQFCDLPKTSGEAEKWACYNGIWIAAHMGARDILVQTDLLSLVNNRPPDYQEAAARWPSEVKVRWRHVKGHTAGKDRRTWVNNWCDREARKHMKEQRKCLQIS